MKNQLNTESHAVDSLPIKAPPVPVSVAVFVQPETNTVPSKAGDEPTVTLTACGLRVIDDEQAEERWF
jgi:hypothetical protein